MLGPKAATAGHYVTPNIENVRKKKTAGSSIPGPLSSFYLFIGDGPGIVAPAVPFLFTFSFLLSQGLTRGHRVAAHICVVLDLREIRK